MPKYLLNWIAMSCGILLMSFVQLYVFQLDVHVELFSEPLIFCIISGIILIQTTIIIIAALVLNKSKLPTKFSLLRCFSFGLLYALIYIPLFIFIPMTWGIWSSNLFILGLYPILLSLPILSVFLKRPESSHAALASG